MKKLLLTAVMLLSAGSIFANDANPSSLLSNMTPGEPVNLFKNMTPVEERRLKLLLKADQETARSERRHRERERRKKESGIWRSDMG